LAADSARALIGAVAGGGKGRQSAQQWAAELARSAGLHERQQVKIPPETRLDFTRPAAAGNYYVPGKNRANIRMRTSHPLIQIHNSAVD